MAIPECPYCGWGLGEWADGKTKAREKITCPNCDKKYICVTIIEPPPEYYSHRVTRLGRKPKDYRRYL